MSLPKIPDLNPNISLKKEDALTLLMASIGMEEIGLSHVINAEGEKIQYMLGTLVDADGNPIPAPAGITADDILKTNESVNGTLKNVMRNQLLLQLKLEDVMEIMATSTLP